MNIQTKDNYDLIAADRKYSVDETEAEVKSTKYPLTKYKRIKPIPGTLGYLFRNLSGKNDAVIEHISNLLGQSGQIGVGGGNARYAKIKNLIILWNNMDDFSKKRVDIFDHLCPILGINRRMFWGWFQEAAFDYDTIMAQTALSGHKVVFIEQLKKHANQPKNQSDRRLMAETLRLSESQAPKIEVKVEDNSTTNVQNNNIRVEQKIPSFVKSIRNSEKVIEATKVDESRMLSEGTTEFIEAELVETREEVLIER